MKRKKREITVTIVNPEALGQASINFTKALFQVFVVKEGMKLELETEKSA